MQQMVTSRHRLQPDGQGHKNNSMAVINQECMTAVGWELWQTEFGLTIDRI